MARKLIKRYLPNSDKLTKNWLLRLLGPVLFHPLLWHVHRRNVAKGVAIGLFYAFIPLPIQMFLAAVTAIILRANLPVSLALVWVSNPITIPPMLYLAYKVGVLIIGAPAGVHHFAFTFDSVMHEVTLIWKQVVVGALVCAAISAVLGYFVFRIFWRFWVIRQWHYRKRRSS